MIRLIHQIRRQLIGSGKVRRYFTYAIGEIVLVVIGILIALQINNWNEGRKEKQVELKTLRELRVNLNFNVKSIDGFAQEQKGLVEDLEKMIRYLDEGLPYHDSLMQLRTGLFWLEQLALSKSTYETLKNRGIEIISDDSLRLQIVDLHENDYQNFTTLIEAVGLAFYTDRASPLARQFGTLKNMWKEPEFYYYLSNKVGWKKDLIGSALQLKIKCLGLIDRIDATINHMNQ
ncbi:MAG: hypothetical protein H6570_16740 [Lewinellaceae bacterium]|nr:hypothetical protein [Lewinellaceae bacterium]